MAEGYAYVKSNGDVYATALGYSYTLTDVAMDSLYAGPLGAGVAKGALYGLSSGALYSVDLKSGSTTWTALTAPAYKGNDITIVAMT